MSYLIHRSSFVWVGVTIIILSLASCAPQAIQETAAVTALPGTTETSLVPNTIRQRISLSQEAGAVAFGDGSIWVVSRTEHQVLRIDMETGKAVGRPIAL